MDDVGIGQDDLPQASAQSKDLGDDLDLSAAPHGFRDWRDDPQLPRRILPDYPQGFYNRRSQPVSILVVHHTASSTDDIFSDNTYHTDQRNWDDSGKTVVHAPHIAYHFYIDRGGQITACNYLWERSWHATNANDKGVGIVCQGDFQSGNVTPTDPQLETLQWIIGLLMALFKLDRNSVWGHGELRQYGNSTTCPGKNFLPAVQAFRTGKDFAPPPTTPGTPDPTTVRWQVVDPNGTQLGLYNLSTMAAAAAEQANSVGIYQSEGQIRLDFRGVQNANPSPPAKWRVADAAGNHVGLYNQTPNAVEHAERIGGYALYLYDSPDGNIRMDFRNLGA